MMHSLDNSAFRIKVCDNGVRHINKWLRSHHTFDRIHQDDLDVQRRAGLPLTKSGASDESSSVIEGRSYSHNFSVVTGIDLLIDSQMFISLI